mmetsp:Transcript_56956/g.185071  ORF Transcript_56956/g.185071 Transcript_56956/m.185071 type:complete len:552 (+) Transcript_56956:207-1862(+)
MHSSHSPAISYNANHESPRTHRETIRISCSEIPACREDRAAVLARYADSARYGSRKELLRHICHVCAWVVLLPDASADVLSIVHLLADMLGRRGQGPLTSRLRNALAPVRHRVEHALVEESIHGDARVAWERLSQCLPLDKTSVEAEKQTLRLVPKVVEESSLAGDGGSLVEGKVLPDSIAEDHDSSLISREEAEFEGGMGSYLVVGQSVDAASRHVKKSTKQLGRWRQHFKAASEHDRRTLVECLEKEAQEAWDRWDASHALCLLHKAAAYLAPPRALTTLYSGRRASDEAFVSIALQTKVRRVLMQLLSIFDPTDIATQAALRCSINHILQLLSTCDGGLSIAQARSSKQWTKLRAMVDEFSVQDHQLHDIAADNARRKDFDVQSLKRKRSRLLKHERAQASDYYQPNVRLKALVMIEHRPKEPKTLRCEHCSRLLNSSWYFVHPRSGEARVLKPQGGHAGCRKFLKRIVHYLVEDGSSYTLDTFVCADFCEHGMRRATCYRCGGCNTCEHGKARFRCKVCRAFIRHRPMREQVTAALHRDAIALAERP